MSCLGHRGKAGFSGKDSNAGKIGAAGEEETKREVVGCTEEAAGVSVQGLSRSQGAGRCGHRSPTGPPESERIQRHVTQNCAFQKSFAFHVIIIKFFYIL